MFRTITAVSLVFMFVTVHAIGAEKTYNLPAIDYPNAIATSVPGGINDRGDIVGAFTDSNRKGHGFLLSNGVYTAIDVPGAAATLARGINSRGDIVGSYQVNPSSRIAPISAMPSPSMADHPLSKLNAAWHFSSFVCRFFAPPGEKSTDKRRKVLCCFQFRKGVISHGRRWHC